MNLSSLQEWKQAKLGQVAKIERKSVQPTDILSGTTYVGLEHIDGEGMFNGVQSVDAGDIASSKFAFDCKHLLYGKLRPYLKKIARPNFSGVCSTDILPILPGKHIDKDFLHYYLRQPKYIELATNRSTGVNLPRLSPKILEEFLIFFPPLEEQKRIAAILDKADAIRRSRQKAIALTEELLRSTFLDMFGDPVTNPKGWEMDLFGNVGVLNRGKSKHRPRNDPSLLNGEYPLIQTGDVANCKGVIESYTQTYSEIGLAQSKMWDAGTLCITIAANIAKTGILGFDACFPDSVVGFQPNKKNTNEYIQGWLQFLQPVLEDRAPQSAQKNINLEILRKLDLPVPPIELQQKFSSFAQKMRDSAKKNESNKILLDNLFNSLLQKAFRGEL